MRSTEPSAFTGIRSAPGTAFRLGDKADERLKTELAAMNDDVQEIDDLVGHLGVAALAGLGSLAILAMQGLVVGQMAGAAPEEIDLFILATATVEQPIPASAAIAQPRLGVMNAACFDLSAACSGFLYALKVARHFVSSGEIDTAMTSVRVLPSASVTRPASVP